MARGTVFCGGVRVGGGGRWVCTERVRQVHRWAEERTECKALCSLWESRRKPDLTWLHTLSLLSWKRTERERETKDTRLVPVHTGAETHTHCSTNWVATPALYCMYYGTCPAPPPSHSSQSQWAFTNDKVMMTKSIQVIFIQIELPFSFHNSKNMTSLMSSVMTVL